MGSIAGAGSAHGARPAGLNRADVKGVIPRLLTHNMRFMAPALVALIAGTMVPSAAWAAIPVYVIGDPIYNPATDTTETIVALLGPAGVQTNTGYAIITAQTVGDTFLLAGINYEVTAVQTADLPAFNGVWEPTHSFREIMTATTKPIMQFIATELGIFGRVQTRKFASPNLASQPINPSKAITTATAKPMLPFGDHQRAFGIFSAVRITALIFVNSA